MNLAFDSDKGGRDQWVAWLAGILAECRRVVKPGGYALVWALPRTSHWTGMALEEAGFALRDQISHLFSSGFPKSQSCLKPAHEIWWLAKAPGPLQPLQIDACRVATHESNFTRPATHAGEHVGWDRPWKHTEEGTARRQAAKDRAAVAAATLGRYPSNLVLSHHHGCSSSGCGDGCPIKALDEQAGTRTSGAKALDHVRTTTKGRTTWGSGQAGGILQSPPEEYPASTGSASRFFPAFGPDPEDAVPFRYCSKASRRDRGQGNTHSTVKSTALMAWLCKLVTPEHGVVLDPFCGSGSTLVACVREGMGFIGIDAELSYVEIARRRVAHEQEQQTGPLFAGISPAST